MYICLITNYGLTQIIILLTVNAHSHMWNEITIPTDKDIKIKIQKDLQQIKINISVIQTSFSLQ